MAAVVLNQVEDDGELPDQFEDAVETSEPVSPEIPSVEGTQMNLDTAIEHAKLAVDHFFNNKFAEAKAVTEPWADSSTYHALGYGVFSYLQAMMTFEQKDIENASNILKKSVEVCNRFRRKSTLSQSFGRMMKQPDYDSYTEEEIHAELCHAECLLLKAVLTFVEDETLVSFVKGGLKIRSCYQSYKECWNILKHRNWPKDDPRKMHFESGVRMGAGSFNLLISLLPQRIIKLLEFVGFSGSRSVGLRELQGGYHLVGSLRRVLNALVLNGFHLIVVYTLGIGDGDLVQAEAIVKEQLQTYPEGVWFLFFRGRLELVQANVDSAISWYVKAWKSQNTWPQFHHICYWELMWAHSMKQDWSSAADYAGYLLKESRWSRCMYAYFRAALLFMQPDLSEERRTEMIGLMKDLPSWKQRIAGKSLPMEKFVIKKSQRFFAQKERLLLPAVELLYVWNGIRIAAKQWSLIESIYRLVERSVKDLEDQPTKGKFYHDDLALALLLKGCCLRFMGSPLQAEDCFLQVTKLEKSIQEDTYLVPYSVAEVGFLYQSMGKLEQAASWLESAKNNYKGYNLESRLHFRLHAALHDLRAALKGERSPVNGPGDSADSFNENGN